MYIPHYKKRHYKHEVICNHTMKCTWGNYKEETSCCDRMFPCSCCGGCGGAPAFWSVNWLAALVHLLNGVITAVLWALSDNRDDVFQLTEEYAPWVPVQNGTCPISQNRIIKISDEWCIERKTEATATLSLWWLIIIFHVLSFLFQAFAMFGWSCKCGAVSCERDYLKEVDEEGANALRMVEYSISATLMQVSIGLILGTWNLLVVIGVAVLTAVTMLFGLLAEQLRQIHIGLAWFAHISGWISMLGVWAILGRQFLFTIEMSTNAPPDFVYAIVIVIGALYMGFGIIQTVQLAMGGDKMIRESSENMPLTEKEVAFNKVLVDRNRGIEMAYCLNSLISKTFLGWIIFANALTGMAKS